MNALREKRRELGKTQAELAQIVGCDDSFVTRLEREERTASLAQALQFERATLGKVRAEDVPMTAETAEALRLLRREQRRSKRRG